MQKLTTALLLCTIAVSLMGCNTTHRPMTEKEEEIAKHIELYKHGKGALDKDPIYPSDDSETGVAWATYTLDPEGQITYDPQERLVPVLREDNLKQGDSIRVECYYKKIGNEISRFVLLARPLQK